MNKSNYPLSPSDTEILALLEMDAEIEVIQFIQQEYTIFQQKSCDDI